MYRANKKRGWISTESELPGSPAPGGYVNGTSKFLLFPWLRQVQSCMLVQIPFRE